MINWKIQRLRLRTRWHIQALKDKRNALEDLLGSEDGSEMDASSIFFFNLEKKNSQSQLILYTASGQLMDFWYLLISRKELWNFLSYSSECREDHIVWYLHQQLLSWNAHYLFKNYRWLSQVWRMEKLLASMVSPWIFIKLFVYSRLTFSLRDLRIRGTCSGLHYYNLGSCKTQ